MSWATGLYWLLRKLRTCGGGGDGGADDAMLPNNEKFPFENKSMVSKINISDINYQIISLFNFE